MPDLPTLTVNQAHFDRIVAAFPGATAAEKAAAYRAWLINHLIDVVTAAESQAVEVTLNAERERQMAAIRASLPPRQTFPAATNPI